MWWVGMRAMGLLLANGGGTGAGYRDLGLGARGPQQGVTWIQGQLRPRKQGACLPSTTPIPSQRLKVVEWGGQQGDRQVQGEEKLGPSFFS